MIIVSMLRGHRSTYLSLFPTPVVEEVLHVSEKKGRSEQLVQKRDELLINRYYFYVKIVGKQYIATLEELEKEFFISQRTIVDNIQKNSSLLKSINTSKPTIASLKKQYPFFNWAYSLQ